MKLKKVLAGLLLLSVLFFSVSTAFAENRGNLEVINDMGQTKAESYFNSFTGVVKEIKDIETREGSKIVSVENEEGAPANIIISPDTYIVNGAEIVVGSTITGFYIADAPMILIYPPQYDAQVVAIEDENQNIKVDLFNEDLISVDNFLKLNITTDTEIISQDGIPFEGELANRKLVVLYGASTRSIPAQTAPTKIIVLVSPRDRIIDVIGDVSVMDIMVNNKKVKAPAAFLNEQNTVMVPLRSITEALGYDVNWNGELQSILIGNGISLSIGEDNYIYMKTMPIKLGNAPELVDGTTFVPLSFFKEVIKMNNAYVFEGQIVIDNEEIMH